MARAVATEPTSDSKEERIGEWAFPLVFFLGCFLFLFPMLSRLNTIDRLWKIGTCYSPHLEKADFDRQSFQYTWLNSYFLIRFENPVRLKHI